MVCQLTAVRSGFYRILGAGGEHDVHANHLCDPTSPRGNRTSGTFASRSLVSSASSRPSRDDVLRASPSLESSDIDEALRYAASLAEDETIEFSV
jgi:hypothetical protein